MARIDVSGEQWPYLVVPKKLGSDGESWTTGGPWVISDPVGKLEAKHFRQGREQCWKTLDYDLYAQRCAGSPGWANRIEAADLYVTHAMNSQLKEKNAWSLMQAGKITEIEAALADIPQDTKLTAESLDALEDQVIRLFTATRDVDFALAKVTKLLWLKRPWLIPMLDSQVLIALYGRAYGSARDQQQFGKLALNNLWDFLTLLLYREEDNETGRVDNAAALQDICEQVSTSVGIWLAENAGWYEGFLLTPIRALESLLWFDWHGYTYEGFGYRRDKTRKRVVRRG